MEGMTREEWIAYHDKQSIKHNQTDFFYEKFCHEIFDEHRGILQFNICDNELFLEEIIGNFAYWNDWLEWIANTTECKKIVGFSDAPNPRRLERLFKSKIVSRENGLWRFERMV